MSAENVQIVREVIGLMNSGGPGLLDRFSPDVVIDMTRRVFNPDTYRGHAGLKRLGREVNEVWADFRVIPVEMVDVGDRVVVIEARSGRGTGSGVQVESRSAAIWTVRGGKVVRLETDFDPSEALEAVGLRE